MSFTNTKNIDINRLREEKQLRYNPLRDLSPQKIVRAMDEFQVGNISDATRIYDAIRRRDAIIQACVAKRNRATSRLEWTIVEQGDDENVSAKHAQFLEEFYNNIEATSAQDGNRHGSMSMVISHILTALENGYSVSEIIWKPNGDSLGAEVRAVPLWYFENTQGILRFKRNAFDTEGEEMKSNGWMIAVSDSPLMEATAVCYLIKHMAMGDWSVFSERFGSAVPVITTRSARNSPEYNELIDVVANFANGCGIVLSEGEVFDLKQASGQGAPFEALISKMERYIALIWRGSDLSTLSADNAAGASLQADESEILEDADCAMVEETIAYYLSRVAIQWRFGRDVKPAAYLQLTRKNRSDKINQIAIFKGATELGCPPAKRDVYEMLELREPEANEDVAELSAMAQPSTNVFANSADDIDSLAIARQKSIQPILDELDRIESIADEDEARIALEKLNENIMSFTDNGDAEATALLEIIKKRISK